MVRKKKKNQQELPRQLSDSEKFGEKFHLNKMTQGDSNAHRGDSKRT